MDFWNLSFPAVVFCQTIHCKYLIEASIIKSGLVVYLREAVENENSESDTEVYDGDPKGGESEGHVFVLHLNCFYVFGHSACDLMDFGWCHRPHASSS